MGGKLLTFFMKIGNKLVKMGMIQKTRKLIFEKRKLNLFALHLYPVIVKFSFE